LAVGVAKLESKRQVGAGVVDGQDLFICLAGRDAPLGAHIDRAAGRHENLRDLFARVVCDLERHRHIRPDAGPAVGDIEGGGDVNTLGKSR